MLNITNLYKEILCILKDSLIFAQNSCNGAAKPFAK